MFKQCPKTKKSVLSCAGLACASLNVGAWLALADDTNGSSAHEQSANATTAAPLTPAMAGPLTPNPSPTRYDTGPFGNVFATGALTGFALWQNNPTLGDRGAQVDLTNAQVFVQKADGILQFFVQGGLYALPAIGTPYINSIKTTNDLWGPIPQVFIKLAPNDNWSVMAGKLPSIVGLEYTFSFQISTSNDKRETSKRPTPEAGGTRMFSPSFFGCANRGLRIEAPAPEEAAAPRSAGTTVDQLNGVWNSEWERSNPFGPAAMRATLGLAPIHTQIWSECSNLWSPHLKPKHPTRTLVGASIAACRSATNRKTGNPNAGKKTSAAAPAIAAQIASTMRNACSRSAMRPASGAEISRIVVARDNASPRRSGPTPCNERNSGKKGDATPKAA
jgi:Putative beta-barrel porin-2, OmpL-like. bbp2